MPLGCRESGIYERRSRFTLATLPAVDFPKVDNADSDVVVSLPQSGVD